MSEILEYCEELEKEKRKWGDGPWMKETNRIDFEHAGLPCFAQRNQVGAWCGYVGVSKGHKAFEMKYDDVNVQVHGGLTYASLCKGHICHVPKPGGDDHVWWFGFDCAHGGDLVPSMSSYKFFQGYGNTYRDEKYVVEQTKFLADQLSLIK